MTLSIQVEFSLSGRESLSTGLKILVFRLVLLGFPRGGEYGTLFHMRGEKILKDLEQELKEVVEVVRGDLATIKTGRAKPSLVESVKVKAYESTMEVRELASITAPDSSLLVIDPYDSNVIKEIERGLRKADLGLNPQVDGEQIKVPIPKLTEERRKELSSLVAEKVESGRVMIRQVRGDVKDEIEDLKGGPGVSEDDIFRWLERMQGAVDEYSEKIEKLGKQKKDEMMTM